MGPFRKFSLRDSVLSAVAGVGVAGALLALDAALPSGWLFGWAPPAAGAQMLLGSVTGAIITVSAVVFWVRGMFVQLSAGQLSSRVLRWYLADRFQRDMLNFLAGALAYLVTVALGVGDGSSAPTIATLVAALMAIGTLLLVVATVWDSAATTQLNEIMARITSDAVDTIRAKHPEAGSAPDVADRRMDLDGDGAPPDVLEAPATGWVHAIDDDRVLAALPAGAVVYLDTHVGDFVLEGSDIGRFSARDAVDGATVASAIVVGHARMRKGNVLLSIRELVDIALQALAPGTSDATSAYEAIHYLGAIMQSILLRDLPIRVRRGAEGRCVVHRADPDHAEYVGIAFDQIRQNGATYPASATVLLGVLNTLADEVARAGLHDRLPALRNQITTTLEAVRRSDMIDADRGHVLGVGESLRWYGAAEGDPDRYGSN